MKFKPKYKNVLYINLTNETSEFKSHEDLWPYIGGVGIAYKLLVDNFDLDPVILASGPLSGKFPFVSKSILLYIGNYKVCEKYGGGDIGSLMNLANIDAIVFYGESSENLKINISGREVNISSFDLEEAMEYKNNTFYMDSRNVISNNYFSFGIDSASFLNIKGRVSLSIDSTGSDALEEFYGYEALYSDILLNFKKLTVEPRNNPSCFGCPMGCDLSSKGEDHINASSIARSLLACGYAESIYKHIPLVYSCLNSIGYKYRHSDIEFVPILVGRVKASLKLLMQKRFEI